MKCDMKNAKVSMETRDVSPSTGYYPGLTLSNKVIPELKDEKVGNICTILLKVKIKSITDDNSGGDTRMDVLEAGYYDEKEEDSENE